MATVRKHRGNWVADYRDQFGKRHRERPGGPFANMTLQRRAAQALLKRRLDEVDRGSFGPQTQRLTFAKVADQYLASKVNIRPSTRRSYSGLIELYLKPYFGAWKIHQVSATDIERYRNALASGLPAPTNITRLFSPAARCSSDGTDGMLRGGQLMLDNRSYDCCMSVYLE